MKFDFNSSKHVDIEDFKLTVYSDKSLFPNASAASIEIEGNHGKTINSFSDIVYYIIEGQGKFVINGEIIEVSKDDVVIVPKNTVYEFCGKMKLFLVHTPAFDAEYDKRL